MDRGAWWATIHEIAKSDATNTFTFFSPHHLYFSDAGLKPEAWKGFVGPLKFWGCPFVGRSEMSPKRPAGTPLASVVMLVGWGRPLDGLPSQRGCLQR